MWLHPMQSAKRFPTGVYDSEYYGQSRLTQNKAIAYQLFIASIIVSFVCAFLLKTVIHSCVKCCQHKNESKKKVRKKKRKHKQKKRERNELNKANKYEMVSTHIMSDSDTIERRKNPKRKHKNKRNHSKKGINMDGLPWKEKKSIAQKVESNHSAVIPLQIWSLHTTPVKLIHACPLFTFCCGGLTCI